MKKYLHICILLLLLLCLGGCGDDAPEEGKPREPVGSVSPASTPTGTEAERFTPTPFRTEPTKEPTKAPTPTATVQYFNRDLTESEEIEAGETLWAQWGEATYRGHIIADAFCLAVWEEDPDWLEYQTRPWTDVCHVYFTSWEDCEFYLYVPGYYLEDGRTGYMKVSKEQFLAFVQSLTRDVEQWVDSGSVAYDDKAPFHVWVENGKVIRLVEAYMP